MSVSRCSTSKWKAHAERGHRRATGASSATCRGEGTDPELQQSSRSRFKNPEADAINKRAASQSGVPRAVTDDDIKPYLMIVEKRLARNTTDGSALHSRACSCRRVPLLRERPGLTTFRVMIELLPVVEHAGRGVVQPAETQKLSHRKRFAASRADAEESKSRQFTENSAGSGWVCATSTSPHRTSCCTRSSTTRHESRNAR